MTGCIGRRGPRTKKPDTRPWWECAFCHARKQAIEPSDCNNCCDCGSWLIVHDPSIPPEPANVRYCNRCGHGYYATEGRCDICGCPEFSHNPHEQTRARAWERLPVSVSKPEGEPTVAKAKKTNPFESGERRKKATLRKIERKHAGKVTQPYAILERLLDEVEAFAPLRAAKFVLMYKRGWKTDKDGILVHAKIHKASEQERERHDDCDFVILLHEELWELKSYKEESREMDLFHELCHASAVLDDETGEQAKDERDRLCWRLRKPPIQEFPEVIERYGLGVAIGLNAEALAALADERARKDAEAAKNDAKRPIIQDEEAVDLATIGALKIPKRAAKALQEKGIETIAELRKLMDRHGIWWHKEVPGLGEESAGKINELVGEWLSAHAA